MNKTQTTIKKNMHINNGGGTKTIILSNSYPLPLEKNL